MIHGRVVRAGLCLLVAVAVLTAACTAAPPVLALGGDFKLTDDDGRPFTLASQRGKVVLIFFGYSSCPDACPTTLSKLSTVYRRLGEDGARVKTLYISVDPDRDTPRVLKADLRNFALDAVGLTGTKAEIDEVVRQYGASYEIVPAPDSAAKYTVAHTTWVYALDPKGRSRIRFDYDASVDEITDGIRALLADAA
jgi:protein SCO1/2